MKIGKNFAALSLILILSGANASAAAIDDELAIISYGQPNSDGDETIEQEQPDSNENKPKSKKERKEEAKRLEEERKAARKKIEEERKKSRDEITGKVPVSKNPMPPDRPVRNAPLPAEEEPAFEQEPLNESAPLVEDNSAAEKPNVSLPNPIVTYSEFSQVVQAVNFTPLYIPKKSGYNITAMMAIDNRIAEIRYGRRWEPSVSLHVRTYRRSLGEDLKDISGVNGVKWRINVKDDTTVYIAKIDENRHVAAWAVGSYTFSAYVENLSFAAFHSLVSDELVDLAQHYYLST